MAFFDDMAAAMETYPVTNVDLEIVEVTTPGDALNVNEQGAFRVKVTNRGLLNLTGVTLRIHGQNGTTVANNGAIAPFESEFVTQEVPTINAHGGEQLTVGSPLKFRAPGGAQDAKTLVKATIESWDANLNRILNGHSRPLDLPKGTFAAEVVDA
jgi:hypothetical protein